MVTIFKQEKGVNALKKLQQSASTGKAKVTGGATLKKRSRNVSTGKSGGVKRLTEQISKFTPNKSNKSAAKRSTQRILTKTPSIPSPGSGSQKGTTNHQSIEEFKKMVDYFNKKYKARNASGKKSSGRSGGKGTRGKLSAT